MPPKGGVPLPQLSVTSDSLRASQHGPGSTSSGCPSALRGPTAPCPREKGTARPPPVSLQWAQGSEKGEEPPRGAHSRSCSPRAAPLPAPGTTTALRPHPGAAAAPGPWAAARSPPWTLASPAWR